MNIDRAFRDKRLFAAALGDLSSWRTWLTVLCAAFALPLDSDQQKIFAAIAGGRSLPAKRVRELWCVAGRRSGKSHIAAAIAVYLSLFIKHRLAKGERGMCLVLAGSRDQALAVMGFVRGLLESSPALLAEVVSVSRYEIELKNRIVIAVHSNSFRTVRGRSLVAGIFDETAFWRDESSALPDVETYRAVLPSLATTGGMLVGISTPYRKLGLLYQKHRDHFAQDGDDILVVQGRTQIFNPTLADSEIAAQRAADPTGAPSEWNAEFRSDLSAWLDDASIDRAIELDRPLELPPRDGVVYKAFTDSSGGVGADSYTLSIAHKENDLCVTDLVRGTAGKFDPHQVTKDYAALCRDYRISEITGDFYGAQWVAGTWRETGINYRRSPLVKSDIYREAEALFMRGLVRLPEHAKLLRELRLLERQTYRSGKDQITHPKNGRDDFANAVCGALYLVGRIPVVTEPPIVSPYVDWGRPWNWPGSHTDHGVGAGIANTPPPPGYQRTHEPWRDFVGPDAVYSHWPGSGPREW
jgi:hypothetical protein